MTKRGSLKNGLGSVAVAASDSTNPVSMKAYTTVTVLRVSIDIAHTNTVSKNSPGKRAVQASATRKLIEPLRDVV